MITYDTYKEVDIAAGHILDAVPVEKSEKLLRLTVDFGEEQPRQVISGIAKYFPDLSTLIGSRCAFVVNLEPRPLMGYESQAMILGASTDEVFSLLRIDESVPPGTRIK